MLHDGSLPRRALVLGGGGITGIAWEIGILVGLAEADADITDADLVIGTSAGSMVGAQITSGRSLHELYASQLEPPGGERVARLARRQAAGYVWSMLRSRGRSTDFGIRMGRLAAKAEASGRIPTSAERIALIGSHLPRRTWPARTLMITAVDADTGELRTFTGADGVALAEAIAASCAVPGVYPPVIIRGRRYIDGGIRSAGNADLAAGYDRVVALTPILRSAERTRRQLAALGVPSVQIGPDQRSVTAIGRNVLDPAARAATVRAGRAQAAAERDRVVAVWNTTPSRPRPAPR